MHLCQLPVSSIPELKLIRFLDLHRFEVRLISMFRITCLFFFLIAASMKFANGQRAFLSKVNGVSRSYHLYNSTTQEDQPNLPLIIFLGIDPAGSESINKSHSISTRFNVPAILIFPTSIREPCAGDSVLTNDLAFLKVIIGEVYENHRINRNKVFIISRGESDCLAEAYVKANPQAIASTRHFSNSEEDLNTLLEAAGYFLTSDAGTSQHYGLWRNPLYNEEEHKKQVEDSIKLARWGRRVSVELRTGLFFMHPFVRTEKDQTYMDISDARQLLDLHITSWMNDSMGWFVDIGWLKLPQKQEVDGARIEAGGGMILPVTFGLRYALYRQKARPYFLLGAGPMPVIVFGGRFSMNSDPNQIKNKIKAEARFALHTTIGTGMDYRIGKRIVVGGHARYIHSSEFKTAGSVNAIRGFNISLSGGYIIGANRLGPKKRKLKNE